MRLLVCGPRDCTVRDAVWAAIDSLVGEYLGDGLPDVLINGCASGADSLAAGWAKTHAVPIVKFPADWRRYGRAAGPIRNQQMLEAGRPTHVLAIQPFDQTTPGTQDMIRRARKAGVLVRVVEV